MEHFGLDEVLGYFRAWRRLDPARDVVVTFGRPVPQFGAEMLRYLRARE